MRGKWWRENDEIGARWGIFTQEVLCHDLHSKGVWLPHRHDMQQNCNFCIRVAQMFILSDIGRKWKTNFVN